MSAYYYSCRLVVAAFVCPPIFISYTVWRCRSDIKKRQEVTKGPLGLLSSSGKQNIRPKREHAVGNLQPYRTVDEWVSSLPRSAKVTLKRVKRIVENQHGIQVECVGPAQKVLGWEHWWVCVDHETRATSLGWFSGLLLGSLRFVAGNITEGSIDEFRRCDNGKLLAWSSMVAKGTTMRNMWFYQRTEASKCLIWFYTVRLAVERCLNLGITHLDLGPSHRDDVKDLKTKYGFQSTINWDGETAATDSNPQYHCDYSGSYVDLSSFYCSTNLAKKDD